MTRNTENTETAEVTVVELDRRGKHFAVNDRRAEDALDRVEAVADPDDYEHGDVVAQVELESESGEILDVEDLDP